MPAISQNYLQKAPTKIMLVSLANVDKLLLLSHFIAVNIHKWVV